MSFLPMTLSEYGGAQVDFVLVTGDAYVDHPSFAKRAYRQMGWFLNGYSVGGDRAARLA